MKIKLKISNIKKTRFEKSKLEKENKIVNKAKL